MDTRQNKARSEADGTPRFDDVEMVEVLIPGDRLNTPVFQVTDVHRKRWPVAYQNFKAGQEDAVDGTPIDQLPGITKAQAQELRYYHILAIEQLASMPDDLLLKAQPMMGRPLRERAQRWVSMTAGNAVEEKLAAENRALRDKMGLMEQNHASMQTAIDGLTAQLARAGNDSAPAPPPIPSAS
jgi:hypothetical protein